MKWWPAFKVFVIEASQQNWREILQVWLMDKNVKEFRKWVNRDGCIIKLKYINTYMIIKENSIQEHYRLIVSFNGW